MKCSKIYFPVSLHQLGAQQSNPLLTLPGVSISPPRSKGSVPQDCPREMQFCSTWLQIQICSPTLSDYSVKCLTECRKITFTRLAQGIQLRNS